MRLAAIKEAYHGLIQKSGGRSPAKRPVELENIRQLEFTASVESDQALSV